MLRLLLFFLPALAFAQADRPADEPAAEAPDVPAVDDAPAPTAAPDAGLLAQEAAAVVDEHCSDAAVAAGTQAARAVATVSDVLARVSEAHDATGQVWLLYWRGVLQQCIDREERAIEDL
jgi:hypothetical protein